jgi:hypothetical protein
MSTTTASIAAARTLKMKGQSGLILLVILFCVAAVYQRSAMNGIARIIVTGDAFNAQHHDHGRNLRDYMGELEQDMLDDIHSQHEEAATHARRDLFASDKFRVGAFGTSSAWGAGLANRYHAYPYLISRQVINYATYSGGPNYPSVCLETLVGDGPTFDVILIDYYYTTLQEGLAPLAKKLRARFPNALMIFIKIWGPYQTRRILPDGSEQTILDFQEQVLGADVPVDDNTTSLLIDAISKDTAEWVFPQRDLEDAYISQTLQTYGMSLYDLQRDVNNVKQTLVDNLPLFVARGRKSLLSELGHSVVATGVQTLIKTLVPNPLSLITQAQDGAWGAGDACNFWFLSGSCTLEFSPGFQLNQYDTLRAKFALELTGSNGWIKANNPFTDSRQLFLSFMSVNQTNIYPGVKVDGGDHPVYLNPVINFDTNGVHVPRTLSVGYLPPGATQLTFTPLEATTLPFRLVGASFTDEETIPLEYDFAPTFHG